MGLSRDQTNKLSESLITTGNKWSISTDKLVTALDSMKESLPFQKLAGWGDKFAGSIAELQGMLGPQFGSEINRMMNMITDVSMDGMRKLSVLGIGDIRERIQNAKDQDEVTKILLEGIKRANNSITSLVGPDGAFGGGGAALEQAVGKGTIAFSTLADNIGERIINPIAVDYANTFAALKSEIWVPLKEFFAQKFYPPFLEVMGYLNKVGKTLSNLLTSGLEEHVDKIGPLFKEISIAIVTFAIDLVPIISEIPNIFKLFLESLTDLTSTMLEVYADFGLHSLSMRTLLPESLGGISDMEAVTQTGRYLSAKAQSEDLRKKTLSDSELKVISALESIKNTLIETKLNPTLEKIKENTQQIADNTEPQQTMSSYLMETTNMLDTAIRGVLGVDGVNQMEKVEGSLEQLVGGQGETISMAEEMQTSTYMTSVANISFNGGF